ncbi:hypothetical protein KAFR_0K02420 [Kazachstania africana CBS 2517]|uniref:C2H2-type domain-containing protein n=1 Tax=Kazachstania africana (strain ATCC 22294 / BCRC 22015 / CBS 2517 / CECT 1963 / NBRC 1671 / NRRL Y-8276) TaxID=1071382 RepID=H2B1U8_KAZAF|nr:hypothetical protein KAFR_0K02420 [Kazachstania africana CBS 2517]CCF60598.1 hypothetical protein KAFR_0K02420 [Kazachstania africana CBS 2517]
MSNFGRRTWNKEEYAAGLHDKGPQPYTENELRQLKAKYTDYNKLMQDSIKNLNQRTLQTNVSQYKKGKQFGFYCDLCDLTYKDTLQYINHLNHKTHELKFNSIFNEDLILNKRDNDDISTEEFEQSYKELLKDFVKENSTRTRQAKQAKIERKSTPTNDSKSEMAQLMGFQNFATSKR